MKGRKATPTALKMLNGNPGKRPLNQNEPVPPASVIPNCPSHITGEGRKEWNRFARILHQIGLLTVIDRTIFALYCQSWGTWVDASKMMAATGYIYLKEGMPYPIVNPYFSIVNRAKEQMVKYLAEMGMTPSSRSRIVAAGFGQDREHDEFD